MNLRGLGIDQDSRFTGFYQFMLWRTLVKRVEKFYNRVLKWESIVALYVYQKVRFLFPGFMVCRRRAVAHVTNSAIRQYDPWSSVTRFQNWYTWALVFYPLPPPSYP